jgi:PTH1 family peptidyl-tRNA hydrolase
LLAERHGGALKRDRSRALVGEVTIAGHRIALAWPQTYYNDSGIAAATLARRYDLLDEVDRIIVVHDELDLPPGRLKVKVGGGLAGNNGLRSIKAHLHTDGFVRVRIGVGKPPGREDGANHVLRRPGKAERIELDVAIEQAADAVEMIVHDGVDAAMGVYNRTETGEPDPSDQP